jgi:hypothetical protein
MVLRRLFPWVQRDEILKQYMPLLDLPSHQPTLDLYLRIDEKLNDKIKDSIIKRHLSLHSVRELLELNNDEQLKAFQFIIELKLNMNYQKQFFEYINDISMKNKISISDILDDESLIRICRDTRMNNPQKINTVFRLLRSKIFPRLSEAEEAFKKTVPFFESSHYRMEVPFKNGKELKEKLMHLSRTEGLIKLQDPWEKDA